MYDGKKEKKKKKNSSAEQQCFLIGTLSLVMIFQAISFAPVGTYTSQYRGR
jgi:hypothetical protein